MDQLARNLAPEISLATVILLHYCHSNLRIIPLSLINVHHAIEKSPKQDIGEEPSNEAPRKERSSGLKILVPPPSSF